MRRLSSTTGRPRRFAVVPARVASRVAPPSVAVAVALPWLRAPVAAADRAGADRLAFGAAFAFAFALAPALAPTAMFALASALTASRL
jgi:hypothetical protein